MEKLQKGLLLLLDKYSVADKAEISDDGRTVCINGKVYPILPWQSERRFRELKGIVDSGRIGHISTCRIGHTAEKGCDLKELLKREMGVLEYTVGSKVTSIFCVGSENVMNAVAETENGCVCTAELAATLRKGTESIDKHEIIADNGVACDRVVDTQMPQQSIYVLGENECTFRDTDTELYGYSEQEVSVIRYAFSLACNEKSREACLAENAHLEKVVGAAAESLRKLENIKVGG